MPADWMQHVYADWVLQYGKEEADKLAAAWHVPACLSIANTELDGLGWE